MQFPKKKENKKRKDEMQGGVSWNRSHKHHQVDANYEHTPKKIK